MVKEAKNINFYTSGRQPSDEDFARISEWIRKSKEASFKTKRNLKPRTKAAR